MPFADPEVRKSYLKYYYYTKLRPKRKFGGLRRVEKVVTSLPMPAILEQRYREADNELEIQYYGLAMLLRRLWSEAPKDEKMEKVRLGLMEALSDRVSILQTRLRYTLIKNRRIEKDVPKN